MDGSEIRSEIRCGGRSVVSRAAKRPVGDGKPVFHHRIATFPPTAINQRQVLKLAHDIRG
jgi:hypothetical protein